MNSRIRLKLITIVLCSLIFHSCTEPETQKMSEDELWVKDLEPDGHSGPTALGEISDLNWNSPIAELKKYAESIHFIIDTTRLRQLALFAYHDLRQTPFSTGPNGLVNHLNKDSHSMGASTVLRNGNGYYYTELDSLGKHTGIDFGFEYWKIDTTNKHHVEQLLSRWKEKYHPMPFYSVIREDNLYVFYTRSVQYARYVQSCITAINTSN